MRFVTTPPVWILTLALCTAPLVAIASDGGDEPDPALQTYLSANGMLNRGLYELAAAEYRQFLSKHDDHEKTPVARYGLGVSLFRMKRYDDAVEALKPLADRSGFDFAAEVSAILGQSHLAKKRYADAQRAFRKVIRKHSDHALAPSASAGRVEALYLDNQYEDAIEACKLFLDRWSDNPLRDRTEFFAALAAMAKKDYSDAAARLEALVSRDSAAPFVEQASFLLAQCYQHDNALENAIRQYRVVLQQTKSRYLPDALLGLSTLLQRKGESRQAGSLLDRLLENDAGNTLAGPAHLQRGRTWFDQQQFDHAFEQFELAGRADDALADKSAYWMAKCKLREGEFIEAARRLAAAINEFPQSTLAAEMFYDRAIALVRAEDHDGAVEALEAFRSRFPEHQLAVETLQLLAVAQHQRQNYDESRRHCREFLEANATHNLAATVAFLLAENEFLAKRYEPAVEAYRRFLTQFTDDPQTTKATFRLGTALYRLERFEEAAAHLAGTTDGRDTEEVYRSALLALGDVAFQRSEWKTAEKHLTDYLAQGLDAPAADDAILKLGLALQRQERNEEALRVFDRLIDRFDESPHRLQAVFERGQVLVTLQRPDEAKNAFQEVLEQGEDSRFAPYALNHLANLATREGDFEKAATLYDSVARSASKDDIGASAMFRRAQAQMASKDYGSAEQSFARFIERYPSHENTPEALARRAVAIARQNRYDDAVEAIKDVEKRAVASLEPQLRAALRYEKAWCLRELGRSDEAAKAYDDLVDDNVAGQFNVHAMLELSGIQVAAERFEEAADVLRRLRQIINDGSVQIPAKVHEQATYRLGVCEYKLDRLREAAELFGEFIDRYPDSELAPSAGFYAGESLFKLGRHDLASKHLSRVADRFEEDPVYAPSLLRLGESLAAQQRWARSERVFTGFLERFPDAEHAYQARYGIGWARENQQRHEEAIQAYRDVVARHQGPTAARAQFQIGECLFAMKRYDQAVRELIKVDILYAYPQWSAAALFEAGRCFEKLGKTVEARTHFQRVAKEHQQTRWAAMASQRLSELSSAMMPGR